MTTALVVHELATNSAKYGALSVPSGKLAIGWSETDGKLTIDWRESDGPVVIPSTHHGFGTRLLCRALQQFGGQIQSRFEPTGLICEMSLILPREPETASNAPTRNIPEAEASAIKLPSAPRIGISSGRDRSWPSCLADGSFKWNILDAHPAESGGIVMPIVDHMTREILVSVPQPCAHVAARALHFPKSSVVMALDQSPVPAVVLVVEDEMLLRMVAIEMVEEAGYIPVEAANADEAVKILESRSDIALMVTDIQMPVEWTASVSRTRCMIAGRRSRSSSFPAR